MAVFEVRGGNDRNSMIRRYARKSKQEAVADLVDTLQCTWNREEQLRELLHQAYLALPDGQFEELHSKIEDILELDRSSQI